jgi:hypothetical protein
VNANGQPDLNLMKTWHWIPLGLVIVLSVGTQIIKRDDLHYWWDKVPGFWAVFGLAGTVLLVGVAILWGRKVVLRKEDYYDRS